MAILNRDAIDFLLACMNIFTFSFIVLKGLLKIYNDKKINYLNVFCETYNIYENNMVLYLNFISEKPININNIFLSHKSKKYFTKRQFLDYIRGIDNTGLPLDKIFYLFDSSIFLEPFVVYRVQVIFKNIEDFDLKNIFDNSTVSIDLLFAKKTIPISQLVKNSSPLIKYSETYFENTIYNDDYFYDDTRGILSDL